jgi:hypothetical protein
MSASERIELAQRRKSEASHHFTNEKDYDAALRAYAGAVDAVRDVQHDRNSTNEMRADLVAIMVTCSNNAATCSAKLGRWDDATRHAQNALILLDSLHEKRGGRLHAVLGRDGNVDARLFGEWRVKSHLVVARSCMEGGGGGGGDDGIDVASGVLRRAHAIAMGYVDELSARRPPLLRSREEDASLRSLTSQTREIRRLMATCAERKRAVRDIEKRRARAMFGRGKKKKGEDDDDDDNPSIGGADSPEKEEGGLLLRRRRRRRQHRPTGGADEEDADEVGADVGGGAAAASSSKTTTPGGGGGGAVPIDGGARSVKFSSSPPQVREYESSPPSSSAAAAAGVGDDNDDDGEDIDDGCGCESRPWYSEHGEALIVLLAVAGFSAVVLLAARRSVR